MNPERLEKFRKWLEECGHPKTLEQVEQLIQEVGKLQKKLRHTSMEELWEIEEQVREDGQLDDKELHELMQLMYHAKELGHNA